MLKIMDILEYIWTFIKFIFSAFFELFNILFSFLEFVFSLATSLPITLSLFFVLLVVVSVAYKVVSLGSSGE